MAHARKRHSPPPDAHSDLGVLAAAMIPVARRILKAWGASDAALVIHPDAVVPFGIQRTNSISVRSEESILRMRGLVKVPGLEALERKVRELHS